MASIVKRKSKYSVVYTCADENGAKKQRWETFSTNAEAKKRKAQIEFQQSTGTFIAPTAKTLCDLLEEYVSIYGINTWALSTYDARRGLIDNYINPLIGDMKLDDITPRLMDKFYKDLQTVKAKPRPYQKPQHEFVSARTVKEIHKLLRNAFNQAVKWELMSRNPVLNATLPKCEAKPREIWTADTLFKALEVCDDDLLALALNLAFSCSLRMGEMLGLTWDCVDISQTSIDSGRASIFVNKELQRATKQSLDELDNKGVVRTFPSVMASKHTVLLLKEPKTKTSVRKVFLPKTVAEMLVQRKQELEELKELLGDEYTDYDLVMCSSNGRPIEGQIINRGLNKLITEHDLPKVVFHSLRHSSITYKLKLNGGDMKSVQGDSGHAQVKMVADVYSHIIDEDRRLNAQRFEEAFYSNSTSEQVAEQPEPTADSAPDDKELLLKLLAKPELATLLKTLAQSL
ncbi:MAG: site-specific integrase [Oscillospiraceae bacterium]|nr:site-specific integrase [Oscillospiraceae bacterium]